MNIIIISIIAFIAFSIGLFISEIYKAVMLADSDKAPEPLKTYYVNARHPDSYLGSVISQYAMECSLEDFGKDWINNLHSRTLIVRVEAANARDACIQLVGKLPMLYSGMGRVKPSEKRYALFAVFDENHEFISYYHLTRC